MSEPIHDGGELDEAEEGAGQLAVTDADAAVGFNAAEEVLNLMAAFVVTAMEAGRVPAATLPGGIQQRASGARKPVQKISESKPLSATTRRCRTQANTGITACWSCCWPGARLTARTRPRASTTAESLVFRPPLVRPIACAA